MDTEIINMDTNEIGVNGMGIQINTLDIQTMKFNKKGDYFKEIESDDMIRNKIIRGEWKDLLSNLCNIDINDCISINYPYFKYIGSSYTYETIITHICRTIDEALLNNDIFSVRINFKSLSVSEINKHKTFLLNLAALMKAKYPNQLEKCYIHNAPTIFTQLLCLISMFVDKETRAKMVLIQ